MIDTQQKKIPEYYPSMYLAGYSPQQILTALRKKMVENAESEDDYEITIISKTGVK